jgi:hypothetical protein
MKPRKIKTQTQEVETTVEVNGIEQDVTLEFAIYPAEAKSESCPGCPAEAELLRTIYSYDGAPVPPGTISTEDIREFGVVALVLRADKEAAQQEDAGIARRERRKGGR